MTENRVRREHFLEVCHRHGGDVNHWGSRVRVTFKRESAEGLVAEKAELNAHAIVRTAFGDFYALTSSDPITHYHLDGIDSSHTCFHFFGKGARSSKSWEWGRRIVEELLVDKQGDVKTTITLVYD